MPRLALALVLILPAFASCFAGCSPSWEVVQASGPPSALHGLEHFVIRTDYSGTAVHGDRESVYATKELEDPEEQAHWAKAKQLMDAGVLDRIAQLSPQVRFELAKGERGSSKGPELLIEYLMIQPGYWGFFRKESIVTARMSFVVGGQVTDQIMAEAEVDPSKWNPTVVDRLANIGRQLGYCGAEFLNEAQSGE